MNDMIASKPAFTLEIRDDLVAVLHIDVPGESMNTLKMSFADEVTEALNQLEQRRDLKGLVLISDKPGSFVAGADISMIDQFTTAADTESVARQGQAMFDRIEQLPMPVVAAIDGVCLGGGLELAMACHYRISSDSGKTVFGLPEVQLGLLPGSSGTQRLPRLIGVQAALPIILTGKQLRPKQAKKLGIVDDVVPASILLDAAVKRALSSKPRVKKVRLSLINRLLERTPFGRSVIFSMARKQAQAKAKGNYPAIDAIIDSIAYGAKHGFQAGLAYEARAFSELAMTAESKQLRRIFFATTEMKKETGAGEVKPARVERVGILGGGLMGGGIAFVTAAKAGIPARIKDIREQGIAHALKYTYDLLNKKVKRRHMARAELEKTMLRLSGSLDYSGFERADVVIEAVFEDLALKQQMVADIETICAKHTIFATNTSSLPITDIAAKAARPENVIGLHYFSPVDKMPLAEIITHAGTSAQTIATTVALAKRQGKTPIVVKDGAGFYVNRILAPYMNEAARLVLAGEPIEVVDQAMVQFGFPVGPMKLMDEVGIDVAAKVAPILANAFGDRFAAPAAFGKLLDDQRKGKKNGKGFYLYSGKAAGKKVDDSVYKLLDVSINAQLAAAEIAQRTVLLMLNEAAYCLAEGIIASPRDGDIGAIFGIGFPPFRGGPFRYMDALGISEVVARLQAYATRHGERYNPAPLLLDYAAANKTFY
jgi:3-hydroxyacyl-CoA dehydrogenase / enoyl-CoA hydratase / 3-hydroxybutyryl-CoA epimerase